MLNRNRDRYGGLPASASDGKSSSGRCPCLGLGARLMLEFIEELGRSRMSQGHNSGNPPGDKRLLTVRQVAENWQVSERTIRRMIADGRLHVIRLGRAVRIPARVVRV
jgi:excisionase family DNA binding protein